MKRLILALMLLASVAGAQVSVTGVAGEVSFGTELTVTGTGFGTKTVAGPWVYDGLEDGDIEYADGGVYDWRSQGGSTPTDGYHDLWIGSASAHLRHSNSSYYAAYDFTSDIPWPDPRNHAHFTMPRNPTSEKYYVHYWLKLGANFVLGEASGENLVNIKTLRLYDSDNDTPGNQENWVDAFNGWDHRQYGHAENVGGPSTNWESGHRMHNSDVWTLDEWHLLQAEFSDSTWDAVGDTFVDDGEFRIWFDGYLVTEGTDLLTREDVNPDDYKHVDDVGFYNSNNGPDPANNDFYLDDAWVDNTWARVEIGNNANYELCTHREVQLATSWSATSITLTANTGSFADEADAYVFVTDEDGTVNATGYPVTINAEGGGEPGPTYGPKNLQASDGR